MNENYQNGYQNDLNGSYPPRQDFYADQQSTYGQPQNLYSDFSQPQDTYNDFGQPQNNYSDYGQPQNTYVDPQSTAVSPQSNKTGLIAMILGIAGAAMSMIPFVFILGLPLSVVALILGIKGRNARPGGDKMATIALILGIVGAVLFLVGLGDTICTVCVCINEW